MTIDSISESAGASPDLRNRRTRKAPAVVDRLPPHSHEAEQGVIGCALIDPQACLPVTVERMRSAGETFYDLRHQTIYEALVTLWDARTGIDLITLQQHLKDMGLLEQIGGIPYLMSCQDAVPSAANLAFYLDIVLDKFVLRSMVRSFTDIVGRIYDYEGDVAEFLDTAERDVLALTSMGDVAVATDARTLVNRSIAAFERMHANQGVPTGITTGFADLDRMTDGMHAGEMIVFAARPSMGKSSLAMNIAEHVAIDCALPVGVFSLEMTADSLMQRTVCSRARVNIRDLQRGFFTERDFPLLTNAAGIVARAPLWIDDTPGLSILQLRARARRMFQAHGIRLLVIDYLQLLHSASGRSQESRQQEVTEISSGVKSLAKELGIPIVVLSQLNRELEKTPNRKPRLADLRESGSIEQDADVVGLLYKANDEEAENEEQANALAINLLIAKQRNGPTGDVHLLFLKNFTRFESVSRVVSDEDERRNPHND